MKIDFISRPNRPSGLLLLCVAAALSGLTLLSTEPAPTSKSHWAFQAPRRPEIPKVKNNAWPTSPIDYFVLARLEKARLSPSPEADRYTLVRRLSLDLIGLLPTPEEADAFARDPRPDAYEALVDRLLSSAHFGERWARHWLDLARYADSDGYEKDLPRPYAYRFRDWVIEAINRDLPFDEFTIEQLAGDLLPEPSLAHKTATGFHRNTLTNTEGGVDQEEFRCKAVVDRVSTTATVWLGLTLGCAECHSHKYDPFTQKEFYQLYAFFNSSYETNVPSIPEKAWAEHQNELAVWETEKTKLQHQLASASEAAVSEAKSQPEADRGKALEILRSRIVPNAADLTAKLNALEKKRPKVPDFKVQTMAELPSPRPTFVHVRGNFLQRGEPVEPGTPAVLPPLYSQARRPNRLHLARWLFDPANPLTSRVAVNRIWSKLFGRGLVASENDFGTRGEPPSHPELLDWLATEFPRSGWSRKALIREIVLSAAYRQSSNHRVDLAEADPNNLLLARQNRFRLEAEIIRDISLQSGGRLNRTIGGPSIRPPLPADITAVGYANSIKWTESPGADKYRRGLYIFFQRTVAYPMLVEFDAPDANTTCTRRERSNTPLQALTLLNDSVFVDCARGLAAAIEAFPGNDERKKLERGFRVALTRPPLTAETDRLLKLFKQQRELLRLNPAKAAEIAAAKEHSENAAATVLVARTLLNLEEFFTRE